MALGTAQHPQERLTPPRNEGFAATPLRTDDRAYPIVMRLEEGAARNSQRGSETQKRNGGAAERQQQEKPPSPELSVYPVRKSGSSPRSDSTQTDSTQKSAFVPNGPGGQDDADKTNLPVSSKPGGLVFIFQKRQVIRIRMTGRPDQNGRSSGSSAGIDGAGAGFGAAGC